MVNKRQASKNEQAEQAIVGIKPRSSRRPDPPRRTATLELLNQVEDDLRGAAGLLRFSPQVEKRYQQLHAAARIQHFVWTSLIGLLLYDFLLTYDWYIMPDVFVKSKIFHIVVTVVDLLTIFMIQRRIVPPESITAILLAIVGNAVYTSYRSQMPNAVLVAFTIPLLVVFGNIVLPLPFRLAIAFSVASVSAASWTIWNHPGLDLGARLFVVMLNASMAFYTLIATYRIEGGERKAYLLTLRETLRGETLVERNRELSELSETDQLTGVANRRVFDRNLEQLWKEHQQSRTPVALLIVDIDHFKKLNDTHGHINGDICLRAVADRLRKLMQAHQSLARFGGEEFAVLLEGEGAYRAAAVAERLRAEIETMPVLLAGSDDKPHRITISVGCAATIPRTDLSPAELFVAADKALYRAKHEGRNRVSTQPLEIGNLSSDEETQAVLATKSEGRLKTSTTQLGLIG